MLYVSSGVCPFPAFELLARLDYWGFSTGFLRARMQAKSMTYDVIHWTFAVVTNRVFKYFLQIVQPAKAQLAFSRRKRFSLTRFVGADGEAGTWARFIG
jgi:hypothetical protein